MRSILVSYQYEIYRTTQQSVKTAVYSSVKYEIVFVMPINGAIRILKKTPPFDSA
jgi:hypothetical protein